MNKRKASAPARVTAHQPVGKTSKASKVTTSNATTLKPAVVPALQGKVWQIVAGESGERLDKWLADAARQGSRGKALQALERGQVFVNDEEQSPALAGRRLQAGDAVRLWLDRPGSAQRRSFAGAGKAKQGRREFTLIYEDQSFLVINKPAGLLTVPLAAQPNEPSLQEQVARYLRAQHIAEPFPVHRLDRDTSGLVIFAKSFAAQKKLKDQFARQQPERSYHAFVHGTPEPAQGQWRDELVWDQEELKQRLPQAGDRLTHEAISRYRVLETYGDTCWLEVRLVSGKRNQIRVQAALHGHPVLGERQYAKRRTPDFARQALHAFQLGLQHPIDGRLLKFEAPLPDDLSQLQAKLRRKKSS